MLAIRGAAASSLVRSRCLGFGFGFGTPPSPAVVGGGGGSSSSWRAAAASVARHRWTGTKPALGGCSRKAPRRIGGPPMAPRMNSGGSVCGSRLPVTTSFGGTRMVRFHTSGSPSLFLHGPLRPTTVGLGPIRLQLHFHPVRCLSSQSDRRGGGGGPFPPKKGGGGGGRNRLTAALGMVGTGTIVFAGKAKYLVGALKLTKFASLGSMILTVGTYSMFFGLPYAAGMVGLILTHETGHALVMMRLGIPFSPMVFVPFMGAAVAMRDRPKDAYEEALVAFGGPYLGTAGAVGVSAAAFATDSQLLYALADFGYMINLFNLLPLGMMDGGRICGALSPYAGVVGLGVGGAMIYEGMIWNPIFYLIMIGGAWTTFQRFYYPGEMPRNYYNISAAQRSAITAGYFGLVAFLMAAMAINGKRKKPPEVLQRERQAEMVYV